MCSTVIVLSHVLDSIGNRCTNKIKKLNKLGTFLKRVLEILVLGFSIL